MKWLITTTTTHMSNSDGNEKKQEMRELLHSFPLSRREITIHASMIKTRLTRSLESPGIAMHGKSSRRLPLK